jgi:hypothetical protein
LPPVIPEDATLAVQKDRQKDIFVNQRNEDYQANLDRFTNGEVSFDEHFIRTQARGQQDFYGEYERKWKQKPDGFIVAPPIQVEPEEIRLNNTKLSYWDRKERKASVNASYDAWSRKMAESSAYDLRLENTLSEEEIAKKQAKLWKKNPYAELKNEYKSTSSTFDLMKSTAKLSAKENAKKALVNEAMEGKEVNPLFKQYMNHFLAVAPQLVALETEGPGQNVQITEASKEAFKAFIERAMENPVEVLKEAVSDHLFSFRQIQDKLLDKKAMAQKFDEVKELRDRFKAITDLFTNRDDEMGKAFEELSENQEEAPHDNILFAKALYQRIDADMRFCLENNKMKFRDNGSLVDRRKTKNLHIAVDGKQSASLLRAVKANATQEQHDDVERYWDQKCKKLLMDDSSKETKADKDFVDNYQIATAVTAIKDEKRSKVKGKENKGLFDDLCDNADQIALAVAQIDKELAKSENIFQQKAAEFKARPMAKAQLEKYLQKRKIQQVNLLERAAGIMNALNYLAGAEQLKANGRQVLDENRVVKNKVTTVTRNNTTDEALVNEFEQVEYIKEEMFGRKEIMGQLSQSALIFKDTKNMLLDKFKDKVDGRLKNLLERGSAELRVNYITMQKTNLLELDYDRVCQLLDQVTTVEEYTQALRSNITANNQNADKLYAKLNNKNLDQMTDKELEYFIRDYKNLQKSIYAANKMRKMKPGISNFTLDVLLKNNRTVQDVEKDKKNDLITNFKFKMISDMVNKYRWEYITNEVQAGSSDSELLSPAEKSKLGKLKTEQSRLYYIKSLALQADNLHGKHFGEFDEALNNDEALAELHSSRHQAAEQQMQDGLHEEEFDIQDEFKEYTKEERKARKNKKNTVLANDFDEKTEEERVRDRDYVLRNKYVRKYGSDILPYFEQEMRGMPNYKNNCLGKISNEVQRFMLCENFGDFKRDEKAINVVPKNTEETDDKPLAVVLNESAKTEEEKTFLSIFKEAYKNLSTSGYVDNIINELVPKKALKNADLDNINLPVEQDNKDFLWLVNHFNAVKNMDDVKDLKKWWEIRNDFFKGVYGQGCNKTVYHKGKALLDAMVESYKIKKNVDGISGYKPQVKQEEQEKTFNLKDNDKDNIYTFDQHQKGSYGCWAASHTYVVNAYMKVHNIEGEKFTQSTFKNEENFIPNETALKYMDDHSDQNPESMSFNQEGQNIQNFLAKDKTGNPYITADTVINALPKTAEHHLVFTNFYLNVLDEKKEEVKPKLTDYIMDKIQGELDRTKTPISLLKSGHYLSVVGVDRSKKELITMDSLKTGKKLEEPTIVKISDLIEIDKFELVYPENLEDENLKYLSDKFGLKKDLYDKDGKMNMNDEEVKKAEKDSLEKPQNMLHVSGVEFERKTRDFDFEENFVSEQIYMPKDLKLKKEETK